MPRDLLQSLIDQIKRSNNVSLLSRVPEVEKLMKANFFEGRKQRPSKQPARQKPKARYTVQPYEEKKQAGPPKFTNTAKLRADVPPYTPTPAKEDEEDDFVISEVNLNPKSKAFKPTAVAKDRFADLGPSENDMNVENVPAKAPADKKARPHRREGKHKDRKQRAKQQRGGAKLPRF